jgi:hypothetical protein
MTRNVIEGPESIADGQLGTSRNAERTPWALEQIQEQFDEYDRG